MFDEEFDRLVNVGDDCFNEALNCISEQSYLEAKVYFLDAYNCYEKAENLAFKYQNISLVSQAKIKKDKALKEAENCKSLHTFYIPIEHEL